MLRRLQLVGLAVALVVAAFSTGWPFLFFLVYVGLLVGGGSYLLTRLGLTDLEAGYAVSQLSGHVGDQLRITYTLRNTGRVPKPLLEAHNPTTLPGGLPGRALALRGRSERSWLVRAPLVRRGHFRIEPLQIRTGDPFGFFEASAGVGQGGLGRGLPAHRAAAVVAASPANIEGSQAAPERTLQTTPLATTVRPWAPGDSMNRIHWKTTARFGEIQVKEFDLEQTADAWVVLDLDASVQAGEGETSTVETAVRVAASVAEKAIVENRAVGVTVNGHRPTVLPADRGGRQRLKILQLLAAVEGDGHAPLAEVLVTTLGRLRRGMTAIVVTPSHDSSYIRPLAALRSRGIVRRRRPRPARAQRATAARLGIPTGPPDVEGEVSEPVRRARALRYALAEYDLPAYVIGPDRPLGEVLAA